MATVYFAYDLLKDKLSPCETIFRETSVGLSTQITFLKAEGELRIGREALTELDERAQMAALNLKTCCTVLDAGSIDPEQFLQCKANARAYDARVEDVVAVVRKEIATAKDATPATARSEAPKADQSAPQATPSITAKIEAARAASLAFNRQVVEVRKEQSLRTLEATPANHVDVTAQEQEPNDNPLATNIIEFDKWVTGSIAAANDSDYYSFTTPDTYRDWIRIELQNQSTTLEPILELFDAQKSSVGSVHNTTPGADLVYAFVALPKAKHAVRVSNYYAKSVGVYLIRVLATKAHDATEPNDDILSAKKISESTPVKAKIMDKNDVDFFSVDVPNGVGSMVVTIANNSTSLHPNVVTYDVSKTEIGNQHNATAGGEVKYPFKTSPDTIYIRVSDYYSDGAGDYTLTVMRQ